MWTRLAIWTIGGAVACACDVAAVETQTASSQGADLRVTRTDLLTDAMDPQLVNAWGMAIDPDVSQIWISANGTDSSVIVAADGTPTGEVIAVPPGAPTGLVYTESPAFGGDEFIFATENGTIDGWQDAAGSGAVVRVDDSTSGAVYKGLAVTGARLVTTDFHNGTVDVYGAGYEEAGGGFEDATIPTGFAPFGVATIGDAIYVSYAMQDADAHDDVAGPGNGFIDVFSAGGRFERRLVSHGALDSPWGMVIAPHSWGGIGGKLLVGNFGDGMINVYEPHSGTWLGALRDADGAPIVIDGLWGLMVAPDGNSVLFSAGPDGESHGLFGRLTVE